MLILYMYRVYTNKGSFFPEKCTSLNAGLINQFKTIVCNTEGGPVGVAALYQIDDMLSCPRGKPNPK